MNGKTIVIAITGGIAAVKVPSLITQFKKQGYTILPIMTHSALQFVSKKEIEDAAGHRVYTTLFSDTHDTKNILKTRSIEHITIAKQADLIVVVPATANIIAKLAHAEANDILTTTILATQAPILICPSMNTTMWKHPGVQQNIQLLKTLHYHILPPTSGQLACGDIGEGRLPEKETIISEIEHILYQSTLLQGKRILITSGGTEEPIDDVRVITNKSSGRMGASLANACIQRGASVTFLMAKDSTQSRFSMPTHTFQTYTDLETLLKHHVPSHDIIIHVAAVSDFTPIKQQGKLSSKKHLTLHFSPREKLYTHIKNIHPTCTLITFKAEPDMSESAWKEILMNTLQNSDIDVVIGNPINKPNQGFSSEQNEVYIATRKGIFQHIPVNSKQNIAQQILRTLFDS
jgi:phosphopantothenoylcysteine decarboxylase/phosphopantothenate--cysteine ligase